MNEWKEILSQGSTDIKHFLICKGAVPIAYMRINKAKETKISMFFVADGFDYEEIYNYGNDFANNYVWQYIIRCAFGTNYKTCRGSNT